jgi:formylglycine-generating enzyme required for sulfatase activity
MFGKAIVRSLLAVALVCCAVVAQAVTIDLVPVGNPGNAGDTRYNSISVGAVPYAYQIGKFEVTAGQYTAFLNAVAASDTYALYNPAMANPSGALGCKIQRPGSPGSYAYSVASDWANRPVNYVSWGDAARFANWLHNGQPTGGQNISTTEDGSYFLNGATSDAALMGVTRKPNATWVIPSEDEWYKAAYYDPSKPGGAGYWDYPTKSNTPPINTLLSPDPGNHANFYDFYRTGNGSYTIGSPYYRTEVGAFANSGSPYGTFDQGGNLWEWNETNVFGYRGLRGGSFGDSSYALLASYRYDYYPSDEHGYIGFRVASVPEPGILAMLAGIALTALLYWWRKRA